ncbi:hypothetical protein ACFX2I_005192 [Malus domestica]
MSMPKRNLNPEAPPFQLHIPPFNNLSQTRHGQTFTYHPIPQNNYSVNDHASNMQELGGGYWNQPISVYNIHMQCGVGLESTFFLGPQYYYGPQAPMIMADDQSLPARISNLRKNIIQQIEYYFSNENLTKDRYLISLMDDKGWVPISAVADFKRLKRMCSDIPFILESLLGSTSVEVQGNMIRRRNEWSKWIPASPNSVSTYSLVA